MSSVETQRWFVRIRGKVIGPFGLDQLQSLRDRGRLQQEHEVSRDRRTWEPAANLAGVFAAAPAAGADGGFSLSPEPAAAPAGDGVAAWYYARNNVEHGPVSWSALKQMGASGELGPDDRVWKGGMAEWEPASEIAGLFGGGSRSSGRSNGKSGTPRAASASRTLIDDLLNQIRKVITASDLDAACRALIQVGGYALLLAMIAGPGLLIVMAVKADSLSGGVFAFAAFFGLIVLRYVAIRLSAACHALVQASQHRLSSTAFPDSLACFLLFLGFGTAGYSIFEGLRQDSGVLTAITMASGAQSLAVWCYAACAALHPRWLNVDCSTTVRAGEEGIGVLAFLLKLFLRFAPVQFGVNASLGALGLVAALCMLLAGGTLAAPAVVAGTAAAMFILFAALIPLFSYLLMAFASVFLDLAQSGIAGPDRTSADTTESRLTA